MNERRPENKGRIPAGLLLIVRSSMLAAIAISSYLAWTSLSGGSVAGCGPDSGCDKVLHSRWGYWFGLPVSLLALLVYILVFALSLRLGKQRSPEEQRKAWPFFLSSAVLMIGAAIWFVALQLFVLHSVCPFCMAGHALGVIAGVIIVAQAPIRPAPEKPWQQEKQIYLPPAVARNFVFFGVAGLALLAGGQTVHRQKMFAVQSVPDIVTKASSPAASSNVAYSAARETPSNALVSSNPTNSLSAPTQAVASVANSGSPSRTAQSPAEFLMPTNALGGNVVDHRLQVYRGMFQFDLREVPVIGSSEARYGMLSLFDYTCHHCRVMHPLLMQAHQLFPTNLAIVSLPMPLDSRCNYTVRRTPLMHSNACQYAQLGLAVWRANKEKQPAFDDFIFTGEKPPAFPAAVDFAAKLVGPEKLERAVRDPWIGEQLGRSIAIYATNYFHIRNGSMPQIMINTNLTTGTLGSVKDLLKILDKQLGLRSAQ